MMQWWKASVSAAAVALLGGAGFLFVRPTAAASMAPPNGETKPLVHKDCCPPGETCPECANETAGAADKDCCPPGETCPECAHETAQVADQDCCPPGETCPECADGPGR